MKSMEQFLIIVLVAGGIHAHVSVDETTCDLRTNTCSPLLEGTVYIQVMTDASGRELKCLKVLPKGNITVFNIKKEKITTDKEFNNRLTFIIKNGTLKISNLRRDDSGQYSIEVFNSNGIQEKNVLFTLDVKDDGKIKVAGILPLMGGVLSALIIFLVVCVTVIFAWRKKQNNKPTKHEEEDDQAITYADVRFTQQQGRQVAQTEEIEVEAEYAHVNSSK
ncbi:uncharacterized protein si:zfos-741a10.3 [Oreochromis niloticus]|uniref:uncharacterized protein si:zfos-741a10.3 n=1 Tax=Oreochromis niloticus TaxID=8128 RepID=UPI000DF37B3C|nr:uncharacterized protein LOC112848334 [Oreochromis niloticus]XP_025767840.1 uncharacterized protein LOC112848334 [Oreochromis niloticus]